MGQVFSDLDYDGDAPVRARPVLGEWGPQEVTSTTSRKRQRVTVVLVFVLALIVIIGVGTMWYKLIWG